MRVPSRSRVLDQDRLSLVAGRDAAEADHRIANHLALIAGAIRWRAANLPVKSTMPTRDVRALLAEISADVEGIGRLHRLLVQSDGAGSVDLAVYLRDVAEIAISSLASDHTTVSFQLVDGCVVGAKQAVSVGLLVSEAMANALKHAHPTGVAGRIHLRSFYGRERRLIIEIFDDGVGLPDGFDPHAEGTGLRLMCGLAAQLGARLSFVPTPIGLCIRLELDAAAPARRTRASASYARKGRRCGGAGQAEMLLPIAGKKPSRT